MSNSLIKIEAKKRMVNHYGYAFLINILLNLAAFGSWTVGFFVGAILASGAISCSYVSFYLSVARGKYHHEGVNSAYNGFRCFLSALWAKLIIWGFSLLIIVFFYILAWFAATMAGATTMNEPVIIIVLVLALLLGLVFLKVRTIFIYHVMCDHEDLSAWQCFKRSLAITKHNFWRIVGLRLSFLGWDILTTMTFGILSLYVTPYRNTAFAILYDTLSNKQLAVAKPVTAN